MITAAPEIARPDSLRSESAPRAAAPGTRRLILRSFQSPGDVVMLTAAVRDLHLAHPGKFQTDVRTSAPPLWEHNPHLTRLDEHDREVESLDVHYPLIHESDRRPYHFIHGYVQYLERQLGVSIPLTRFGGDVHLSPEEKRRPSPLTALGHDGPFWIVMAGGKHDFTAKWWNPASYQAVVDYFQGRIQFVQCGEAGHFHPRLSGVIDLVGKTSLREFVLLMHHADGVLCPVTFAMHLAAAVETRPGKPPHRACIVVAGGREPAHWEQYPQHQFLSTVGMLPCCQSGACWRSRCQLVGDGDAKDRQQVCERPVQVSAELRIPRCQEMISPADVIRRIELHHSEGVLQYLPPPRSGIGDDSVGLSQPPGIVTDSATSPAPIAPHPETREDSLPMTPQFAPPAPAAPPPETPATAAIPVLIDFRHGLGDAVQLTTLLLHLRHYHPEWQIDVASGIGKHTCFAGLCRRSFIRDRDTIDRSAYTHVWELSWDECSCCIPCAPSTKAEHCLRTVFQLEPIAELCRYQIETNAAARAAARTYLESVCGAGSDRDGRFPAVLIHYEANTSTEKKNLPHELIRRVCDTVREAGHTPIILDWDRRSPLVDGVQIHNPGVDAPLWGATGTGDAETLAALIEQASLMIGVDSGPLHVAGACSTPTIALWTGHHPLHYFGLADHVLHLVPEHHPSLLRCGAASGQAFFEGRYRYRVYSQLEAALVRAVGEALPGEHDDLIRQRDFWVRRNNIAQDLVIVQDIAEEDSYRIAELDVPGPVAVDVGAHIGVFSRAFRRRHPSAKIVAVECCPENIAALERNVGGFAAIVPAALTYERDVALLNAVFPDCVSTGGSTVIPREQLAALIAEHRAEHPASHAPQGDANSATEGAGQHRPDAPELDGYWLDARPMPTLTLEELMERNELDRIDVLKLDCEGSEFSILEHSTSLDFVAAIVGEYHGRERFLELVSRRFADWQFRILRDGDIGTFWLINPRKPTSRSGICEDSDGVVQRPGIVTDSATFPRLGDSVPPTPDVATPTRSASEAHPTPTRSASEASPTPTRSASEGPSPLTRSASEASSTDTFWAHFLKIIHPIDQPVPDAWRRCYCTLFELACELRPQRVCEIGVRAGYSAYAILSANPGAQMLGVEADLDEREHNTHGGRKGLCRHAEHILAPFDNHLLIADSHQLARLPRCDLVYVDGDHTFDGCLADLRLAERSTNRILVDDYDSIGAVREACQRFAAERSDFLTRYIDNGLTGFLLFEREPSPLPLGEAG